MMKKMITTALAVVMMVSLTACGGAKTDSAKKLEGSTSELIEKVYEQSKPEIDVITSEVDLTNEQVLKSFTGLDNADKISEASASESAIGAQAYSLVMVRVKDAKDAKEVAEAMKAGIDTRKWICVEADNVQVAGYEDVVLFFMVSSELQEYANSKGIIDAFKTVCGGTLSFEL